VLRILGEDNRVIERFLRDADTVVGELASHRREVARFLSQAGDTAETVATRRAELREATRRLPAFLGELRPSMRRLGELADRSVPLLADLQRAAPDLRLVLDRLGPFSSAALPALRKLGGAAQVGTGALRDGRRAVDELRRLAGDAPGTAKPLRQFLQTMDDRRRATDRDPRATVDGPPPSDPSYEGGRGGFTGFESIANYFFWQALSVNAFDDLGHMLTVTANTGQCAEFANDPSERQVLEACNSWLGPRQPGINAPDPSTVGGAAAIRRGAAAEGKRRGGGTRRGPGEAPAGTPGRAPSRPQVGLPAPLEQLLVGDLPGATPGQGGQLLLDYLLGP
jgi:hypothetical protein